MELDYTVTSAKPHAEVVAAVQAKSVEKGFRVQHVHEVHNTLAEKGFVLEPYSIVEI